MEHMTDAELLDQISRIRQTCDQLARSMANHSDVHDGHALTECTEGVARVILGFTDMAHRTSCVSRELMVDLAEAVRDLIQDWGDATGGDRTN